jgi:hypothetical protein
MTLATDEFIRRFLMHILPKGFHRIRHYGLLANGSRADNVAIARSNSSSRALTASILSRKLPAELITIACSRALGEVVPCMAGRHDTSSPQAGRWWIQYFAF